MSAWSGSEFERAQEDRRAELARIESEVRHNGPSLTPDDVRELARKLYDQRHPVPVKKCCPCFGKSAEYVRAGEYLGICKCDCHKPRMREP